MMSWKFTLLCWALDRFCPVGGPQPPGTPPDTPPTLGHVEGLISPQQQLLKSFTVLISGDAAAEGGWGNGLSRAGGSGQELRSQDLALALTALHRLGRRTPLQQQQKLLPTPAKQQITATGRPLEHGSNVLNHLVAHRVAVAVINQLEKSMSNKITANRSCRRRASFTRRANRVSISVRLSRPVSLSVISRF